MDSGSFLSRDFRRKVFAHLIATTRKRVWQKSARIITTEAIEAKRETTEIVIKVKIVIKISVFNSSSIYDLCL